MAITNASTGTNVHEIADGIYRINTPVAIVPGGFSFNQYLVIDDQPLLFHTGPRKMFPLVLEAVESVIPASRGGKLKTVLQALGLTLVITPLDWLHTLGLWVMYAAVVVTVVPGIDYVQQAARGRSGRP